jgi:hypothetical protein
MDWTQWPKWTPDTAGAALDQMGGEMTAEWPRAVKGLGAQRWQKRQVARDLVTGSTCYQETERDRELWAEWYAPIDDDWNGADDYELTEEDWARAAKIQAKEAAADPEYAALDTLATWTLEGVAAPVEASRS